MWIDRIFAGFTAVLASVGIYRLISNWYDVSYIDVACAWLVVMVSVVSTNVYELLRRATEGSEE